MQKKRLKGYISHIASYLSHPLLPESVPLKMCTLFVMYYVASNVKSIFKLHLKI